MMCLIRTDNFFRQLNLNTRKLSDQFATNASFDRIFLIANHSDKLEKKNYLLIRRGLVFRTSQIYTTQIQSKHTTT